MIEHIIHDCKKNLVSSEEKDKTLGEMNILLRDLILVCCEDRGISNALKSEMVVNVQEKMEKSSEKQIEKKKSFFSFLGTKDN
jgi:hypothetical protein